MHISNALLRYGYSQFSLTIIMYIEVKDLPKEEAVKLILKWEQHYLDFLLPQFNKSPTATSRLGVRISDETRLAMSKAKSGENNPMFGTIGRTHSIETIEAIRIANSGENHRMFGKTHSAETKAKISIARDTVIHRCNSGESMIINSFPFATKAAEYFKCDRQTIMNYTKSGKLFQAKWILSTLKNNPSEPSL